MEMQHHLTAPQHPGTIFYINEQHVTLSKLKTELENILVLQILIFIYL